MCVATATPPMRVNQRFGVRHPSHCFTPATAPITHANSLVALYKTKINIGTRLLRFQSAVRKTNKSCNFFFLAQSYKRRAISVSIVDTLGEVENLQSPDCGKQNGNGSGQGESSSRYTRIPTQRVQDFRGSYMKDIEWYVGMISHRTSQSAGTAQTGIVRAHMKKATIFPDARGETGA